MTYENFLERVKEEIIPLLPSDVEHVVIQPVTKNNGYIFDGLVMISQYLNISPTIYMNPYYNEYIAGRPFENILSDIADTYMENCPQKNFDVTQFADWDKAKSRVARRLINYEQNKELLEVMPHKRVEDLAVVYQVIVNDEVVEDEYATIGIFNQHLKLWDVTLEELDKLAVENTNRLLPFRFQSMMETLKELSGGTPIPFDNDISFYYLGNKPKIHGAIHVLDENLMDRIKKIVGSEYYVIPSSIHEVLILPMDPEFDYVELESMIQEVNETSLDPMDILSNKAYVVDAVNHKFVLAERYKEYKLELRVREQITKEKEKKLEEPKSPKM